MMNPQKVINELEEEGDKLREVACQNEELQKRVCNAYAWVKSAS